jgi:hypothetical protein
MIEAYGYKQQIIDNLIDIDDNNYNFYNYHDLKFLSKLKSKNNNLAIIFHGSIPSNGIPSNHITSNNIPITSTDRVYFRGYDYEINNTDIICISDYLMSKYDEYEINWTLSTEKYDIEYIYEELFTYIINKKKYNSIIFCGTSAGGFPSLKFACKFNSTALISNSQIYLEKYTNIDNMKGFDYLKNMVNENNDKLIYENKQIETIINNSKPKQVIIYNNKKDLITYKYHLLPFIEYIENNNLSNIFQINLFDFDGVVPKRKTQHSIQFPDSKNLGNVLQELLG